MLSILRPLALALLFAWPGWTAAAELAVLARPGPWPAADRLIAYRGEIWFSSAVKGVNHNSADIWSYDPVTRRARFRRYLFSQDAGRPVVHRGLLYWPHEDMRIGLGLGVLSVTNGIDWRNLYLSVGDYMMHTHAAAEWRGRLVAAMAGWRSALAASRDGGVSWRTLVNAPARVGSFHRYNDLAAAGDRLFVRHWQKTGVSLAEYRDGAVVPVTGWPDTGDLLDMASFRGALYGLVEGSNGGNELWRLAEGAPERVLIGEGRPDLRVLVSNDRALFVIAQTETGGQVWTSGDGLRFKRGDSFVGGRPLSAVATAPGTVFVGGAGFDGRAMLWGPKGTSPPRRRAGTIPLPGQPATAETKLDADTARRRLRRALADPANYDNRGQPLQAVIDAIAAGNPPPGFFAAFLDAAVPDRRIPTFGGRYHTDAREIATWRLMNAMARRGEASVPVRYLSAPWRRAPNGPQKWFDPLLIALHAIQASGQNDEPTIDALIRRLDFADDPDWLRSQVTGTLTAVTRQAFGYDVAAWKRWWKAVKRE